MEKQRKLPLYIQIKNKLVENIKQGVWRPGTTIPSESQLMQRYNVSRTTVRQAIKDLAHDGLLETHRGKSATVQAVPHDQLGNPGVIHHEIGDDMRVKVLRSGLVSNRSLAQKKLNVSTEEDVYLLERIRLADRRPIGIQQLFMPKDIVEKVAKHAADSFDIFPILGEHDIFHINIHEQVSAANATQYEADLLGIMSGEALIDIDRVTIGVDRTPIEYSHTLYLTEYFHYIVEIGR